MQLAADDLTPGMFVTILDTEAPARHQEGPGAAPPGTSKASRDYTGSGAVLRVLSMSLPFVLVQNMTPGMLRGPRVFPVDLRRSRLTVLADEYVRSAIGDPPPLDEAISPIDAGIIDEAGAAPDDDDPKTPSEKDFGGGIYFLGGGS